MDTHLDAFFKSTKPPETPSWMNNVVYVFINGIPEDCHKYCSSSSNYDETTIDREELATFVRERLQTLADREYKLWVNGRMPYITPRELQLWRLRQFVQYIWFWNLPDDDDLAMIFNQTRRKASNLISDFIARFRKTLLFPISLRRLHQLLLSEPVKADIPHDRKEHVIGNAYHVLNKRYLDDCNMLIHELRIRLKYEHITLSDSYFYDKDNLFIWVDTQVVDYVSNNNEMVEDIFNIYREPEHEHE